MGCPIPKWLRKRIVPECKEESLKLNNDELKRAALVFAEVHYRYSTPFETFVCETGVCSRNGKGFGKYRISVQEIASENGEEE